MITVEEDNCNKIKLLKKTLLENKNMICAYASFKSVCTLQGITKSFLQFSVTCDLVIFAGTAELQIFYAWQLCGSW